MSDNGESGDIDGETAAHRALEGGFESSSPGGDDYSSGSGGPDLGDNPEFGPSSSPRGRFKSALMSDSPNPSLESVEGLEGLSDDWDKRLYRGITKIARASGNEAWIDIGLGLVGYVIFASSSASESSSVDTDSSSSSNEDSSGGESNYEVVEFGR